MKRAGYIWHIPGFKGRTFVRFGFSTEGILISASAVPHCRFMLTWLNRRQTVSHNDVMPGPDRHNEWWWRDDAVAGCNISWTSRINRQLTRYVGPNACPTLTPRFILTKTCRKPNPKFNNRNAVIARELRFCCVAPKMWRHLRPHN